MVGCLLLGGVVFDLSLIDDGLDSIHFFSLVSLRAAAALSLFMISLLGSLLSSSLSVLMFRCHFTVSKVPDFSF